MIDTHCHLDVDAFSADRDQVVARAHAAGVTTMIVPAIRPSMWRALHTWAARHPSVRVAMGVHPQVVPELLPGEINDVIDADNGNRYDVAAAAAALQAATVRTATACGAIAIGECGLDGGTADRPRQEALFRAQIRAARELGLPLIVHVLRAHDAAPRILREERAHEVGGVLHSYSGSVDLIPIYRDLGMAFSFGGPVTWPHAKRPRAAAAAVPADLLLAETDAPDQAAWAKRGARSEPADLPLVLAALAELRGVAVADMVATTTANARRIFKMP